MKCVCTRTGLVAILALFACDDVTGPVQEFDWSGTVAVGDTLEIKGIIGSIRALPATGSRAMVNAVKRGERSDPASVTIDTVVHSGGVTICAVYPDVPGKPANRCLPGDGGHMSVQGNDVEVEFSVTVPAGVVFIAKTITGSITGTDLAGDAFATTVTGSVDLSTAGVATASTVTGSVNATISSTDWGRDLAFTTVTGSVTVAIPATCSAFVRLSTVTGNVFSDFSLPEISATVRQGPIGNGGPQLLLSTVTGSVTLRRR